MLKQLRDNIALAISSFTVVAMLVGAVTWVFTTFALAEDLRTTNVEMLQMQIDSASKEIREYRREIRGAGNDVLRAALEMEMQEAIDARLKLEKRQMRIANDGG